MQPIRLCMITFDWYPFDIRVRRMSEAAADAGYHVDVICLRQPDEREYEVANGVHVHRVPLNRTYDRTLVQSLASWTWFLVQAGAKVAQLHLRRRYDVVHVHNMPDFLVFAALVPKLSGAKVVLDVQDVSPELMAAKATGGKRLVLRRLAELQERVSVAFSDHVVTVGWPFEKLLLQRGVSADKLSIILNSADPKLFPEARRGRAPHMRAAGRPFIVMYHGTVAERNGVDIAVRAVSIAASSITELELHIMGRGEMLLPVRELAAELGVADRLKLYDPVPSDEIVDFVVRGDVGIIPYRRDGFAELVLPTKAYEFAWMGRPMIASDTQAIRSMFRPTSIALCDPDRPETFAASIVDLYEHAERRDQMVADAAEDYAAYRWENMAERYAQLLAHLGTRKKPTRRKINVLAKARRPRWATARTFGYLTAGAAAWALLGLLLAARRDGRGRRSLRAK